MSGIAGVISKPNVILDETRLQQMCNAIQHRGQNDIIIEKGSVYTLASVQLLQTRNKKNGEHLRRYGLAIAADVSLYNKDYLLGRLADKYTLMREASDREILLACYQRWGTSMLDIIDGDYAFVIWDAERRRLFAARDPFGLRPFFYLPKNNSFFFASEVKQILFGSGTQGAPNRQIVGEFLLSGFEEVGQSFYDGILRLKPGHYIETDDLNVILEKRYWKPDLREQLWLPNTQDYYEQFRRLLRDAVQKRIVNEYPVVSHLSGGLDSSSIVTMAGDIYRKGDPFPVQFETISAAYEGLDCDESAYFQSVVDQIGFNSNRICPLTASTTVGVKEHICSSDTPFVDLHMGTVKQTNEAIERIGARVLLMGIGGDEILTERYLLEELAKNFRFIRLLKEVNALGEAAEWSRTRLIGESMKSLIPSWIKTLRRSVIKRTPITPPWINPDFYAWFTSLPAIKKVGEADWQSLVQRTNYRDVTHPVMPWLCEMYDANGAYNGYEVRLPFLDRPLVEFVLKIPFEHRISGEKWKSLVREGLKSDLPEKILCQKRKINLNAYAIRCFQSARGEICAYLNDHTSWLSEHFVDRSRALKYIEYSRKDNDVSYIYNVWRIYCLEIWLREIDEQNRKN